MIRVTADFDKALNEAASTILKRELSDEERREFRDLADTIGMGSVEDYLYMLMVFKRNEDKITAELTSFGNGLTARLEELSSLEKKINETLEISIERVLGEGASKIGAEMGEAIAEGAEETLSSFGEYRSVRGQIILACFVCMVSALSYWLGSARFLESLSSGGWLEALLFLPAGWCVFFCGVAFALLWAGDHWDGIRKTALYKTLLGIQIFLLSLLALALL
jgi:hypothetical protein